MLALVPGTAADHSNDDAGRDALQFVRFPALLVLEPTLFMCSRHLVYELLISLESDAVAEFVLVAIGDDDVKRVFVDYSP